MTKTWLRATVRSLRRVAAIVASIAILTSATLPLPVEADHYAGHQALATLEGTFALTFDSDCAFRATTASGQVHVQVDQIDDDPLTIWVAVAFAGTQQIENRGTCPLWANPHDWNVAVEYDDEAQGIGLEVDRATGSFSGSGAIYYWADGVGVCVPAPAGLNCDTDQSGFNDIHLDHVYEVLAFTVSGTLNESGLVSAQMSGSSGVGQVEETHFTGSLQASGAPFSFSPTETTGPDEPTPTADLERCEAPTAHATGRPLAAADGFIGEATTEADLAIDHVEVVQVVQTAGNSVPLVAFKSTVVRVFVINLTPTDATAGAKVTLTVELNGQAIGPPLNQCVLAAAAVNREKLELNEAQFWLPTFSSGDAIVRAEAIGIAGVVDPNPTNNIATVQVTFEDGPPQTQIAYVPICLPADACPAGSEIAGIGSWVTAAQNMFPIRDGGLSWYRLPGPPWRYPGLPWWAAWDPLVNRETFFTTWLRSQYDVATAASWKQLSRWPEVLIGVVPTDVPLKPGGQADPTGGHTAWVRANLGGYGLAHELGHIWGLHHVQDAACDQAASFPAGPPFDTLSSGTSLIGEPGIDRSTGAAVVVASTARDLMSYCAGDQWMSPDHYTTLFRNRLSPVSGNAPVPIAGRAGAIAQASDTSDYLVILGAVAREGASGALGPTTRIASANDYGGALTSTQGRVCVVLTGSASESVQRCFDPSFTEPESGTAYDAAGFSVVVPIPAGLARLALTVDGTELDAIDASANPPSISADAHNGETWTTSSDLTWSVSDADGDTPTVTVLYSPDGGELWLPYAPNWADNRLTVDPSQLQGTDKNLFRIIASDGLNTTSVDIGPITVPASVGVQLPALDEGCALERDCPPATPGPLRGTGLDLLLVVALIGLVALLLAGLILAIVVRGRRQLVPVAAVAYTVPFSGLPAWSTPSATGPPVNVLPAGLQLTVVEWLPSGWAHVAASNGWSGWVDGRLLVPVGR